jgi:hypothetical protein
MLSYTRIMPISLSVLSLDVICLLIVASVPMYSRSKRELYHLLLQFIVFERSSSYRLVRELSCWNIHIETESRHRVQFRNAFTHVVYKFSLVYLSFVLTYSGEICYTFDLKQKNKVSVLSKSYCQVR